MNDTTVAVLHVVGSDTVARRNVLYCEEVVDASTLLGRRFKCVSLPFEVTLECLSTCGTTALTAFAYSGGPVPPEERLEFHEIAVQ